MIKGLGWISRSSQAARMLQEAQCFSDRYQKCLTKLVRVILYPQTQQFTQKGMLSPTFTNPNLPS